MAGLDNDGSITRVLTTTVLCVLSIYIKGAHSHCLSNAHVHVIPEETSVLSVT